MCIRDSGCLRGRGVDARFQQKGALLGEATGPLRTLLRASPNDATALVCADTPPDTVYRRKPAQEPASGASWSRSMPDNQGNEMGGRVGLNAIGPLRRTTHGITVMRYSPAGSPL